jgi:hypothetical protein
MSVRHAFGISVLLSSFIFFLYYLWILIFTSIGIIAGKSPAPAFTALPVIVPALIAIISLTGSVYAVKELKKRSPRWYFAVPFVISLVIICIFSFFDLVTGVHTLDPFIAQELAAITTPGFFFAFPESERRTTRLFSAFSGVISLGLIGSFLMLVPDLIHPGRSELFIGIVIISMIIAMPLIGICFVMTAFLVRDKVPTGPQQT